MAKRQKISYNGETLTENLRQSNGKGVDAFFPDHSPEPVSPSTNELPHAQVDADMHARTDARTHASVHEPEHLSTDSDAETDVHGRTDAQTAARTHAPAQSDPRPNTMQEVLPMTTEEESVDIDELRRRVSAKRHLSSFTFRFRANELEELDLVVDELNQDDDLKVSKNDAVRTALNWLLADYKLHKDDSVLARVLTDT